MITKEMIVKGAVLNRAYPVLEVKVQDVIDGTVFYLTGSNIITLSLDVDRFVERANTLGMTLKGELKPLDKAIAALGKEYCLHRNVRTDKFFTSYVYKTCKDCGKALN